MGAMTFPRAWGMITAGSDVKKAGPRSSSRTSFTAPSKTRNRILARAEKHHVNVNLTALATLGASKPLFPSEPRPRLSRLDKNDIEFTHESMAP
ncbi:hypothetical protein FOVSG1_010640 [Fusarium oxysporum f. sp. vasinfectum]